MKSDSAFDGREVANFILDFCDRTGRRVTNLSLQKIVYFCHVWSLIELGRPLIRHQFEAWQFGPVLQYLYREFKAFDDRPIATRATRLDPSNGKKIVADYQFDDNTERLLLRVADFYTQIRTSDLVKLSHAEGGPWDKVWNHNGPSNPGMKIEDENIVHFYSRAPLPFLIQ